MAIFRSVLSAVLLVCALVVAVLAFSYDGYQEDNGSTPLDTLWWAIPWAGATAVLSLVVIAALFSAERRASWSWISLGFASAMAAGLVALFAWA